MNVECAAFHQANHRIRAADYGPRIRAGIEMGLVIPPTTYLKALCLRREFRAAMNEMAQQADVLMMPATPDACAQGPQHHWRRRLPVAMDCRRAAHGGGASGPE